MHIQRFEKIKFSVFLETEIVNVQTFFIKFPKLFTLEVFPFWELNESSGFKF